MTKILLATLVLTAILFASSTQVFAMPMQYKTQDIMNNYSITRNATLDDHYILTSDPPTTKGGKPTFHLIPRPQEGIDNTPIPKTPDTPMMLVAETPTSKSSIPVYHWVPVPVPNSRDSSS